MQDNQIADPSPLRGSLPWTAPTLVKLDAADEAETNVNVGPEIIVLVS